MQQGKKSDMDKFNLSDYPDLEHDSALKNKKVVYVRKIKQDANRMQ